MNKVVAAVFFVFILAAVAWADDVVKSFTFQTIDGKTIEYRATSGMNPAAKKEVLDNLVLTILKDLNETEKKDLLRIAVMGQKEGHHLTAMVEY